MSLLIERNFNFFTRIKFHKLNLIEQRIHKRFINKQSLNVINKNEKEKIHPYLKLYPWKSLTQFVDYLQSNIVYTGNDGLIAINKPFGVGIHKSIVNINKKKKSLLLTEIIGDSKYSIADALKPLSERLNTNLKLIKANDRNTSGIILLATNDDVERKVSTAFDRAKCLRKPNLVYWCITKGYPMIHETTLTEHVGIKLLEIDELGDHKEPQIIFSPSKTQLKDNQIFPIRCEMKIVNANKEISTSLVQLAITKNKWQFIRCYMASKTSFILGDTRFCSRVSEVLGTPIQVSPFHISWDNRDPLPQEIAERLQVDRNGQIPLMIHLAGILLPKYNKDKSDLFISAKEVPEHFHWTLKQLNLIV